MRKINGSLFLECLILSLFVLFLPLLLLLPLLNICQLCSKALTMIQIVKETVSTVNIGDLLIEIQDNFVHHLITESSS